MSKKSNSLERKSRKHDCFEFLERNGWTVSSKNLENPSHSVVFVLEGKTPKNVGNIHRNLCELFGIAKTKTQFLEYLDCVSDQVMSAEDFHRKYGATQHCLAECCSMGLKFYEIMDAA